MLNNTSLLTEIGSDRYPRVVIDGPERNRKARRLDARCKRRKHGRDESGKVYGKLSNLRMRLALRKTRERLACERKARRA